MSKEIADYVSGAHVSKNSEGFLKRLTDNKYVAKAALYATLAAGAMGLYAGNYTANNARAEVVTVNAPFTPTDNGNHNASNLQDTGYNLVVRGDIPTTATGVIIQVPNAIYGGGGGSWTLSAIGALPTTYTALQDPIPISPLGVNDYPTTGVIMQSGLDLQGNVHLKNFIFDYKNSPNPPSQGITVRDDHVGASHCYFIGNGKIPNVSVNFPIEVPTTGITDANFDGNYMRDFLYGAMIRDFNTVWTKNIFRNCASGFYGNAYANLSNENVFYESDLIATISEGLATPQGASIHTQSAPAFLLLNNYYYNPNTSKIMDSNEAQTYIYDGRTTTTTSLQGISLQTLASDIQISSHLGTNSLPDYHFLFPEPPNAASPAWLMYDSNNYEKSTSSTK